ncbi:hypothetical protein ABZ802_32940 [Streptomyces sp. NPDC047737]|uniref:hypothetical protein n=1 Tax=Streptomyces sp. NPDC047737 TaxID=3155740 RepID=UPI00341171BF
MHLEEALVGLWSSTPFDYGVMEASELVFLPDGRGLSVWHTVAAMYVTHFRWGCPAPGLLELRAEWTVEGEPGGSGDPFAFSAMQQPEAADEVTRHHYSVGPAVPPPGGEPVLAVAFREPVEFCTTFARRSGTAAFEEDPALRSLLRPGGQERRSAGA